MWGEKFSLQGTESQKMDNSIGRSTEETVRKEYNFVSNPFSWNSIHIRWGVPQRVKWKIRTKHYFHNESTIKEKWIGGEFAD